MFCPLAEIQGTDDLTDVFFGKIQADVFQGMPEFIYMDSLNLSHFIVFQRNIIQNGVHGISHDKLPGAGFHIFQKLHLGQNTFLIFIIYVNSRPLASIIPSGQSFQTGEIKQGNFLPVFPLIKRVRSIPHIIARISPDS